VPVTEPTTTTTATSIDDAPTGESIDATQSGDAPPSDAIGEESAVLLGLSLLYVILIGAGICCCLLFLIVCGVLLARRGGNDDGGEFGQSQKYAETASFEGLDYLDDDDADLDLDLSPASAVIDPITNVDDLDNASSSSSAPPPDEQSDELAIVDLSDELDIEMLDLED
jgi:hypothetical protein